MIEAVSSGGVVIFRGKILVLYKHLHNKYEGWVLPKGTIEEGETQAQTALKNFISIFAVQLLQRRDTADAARPAVPADTQVKGFHQRFDDQLFVVSGLNIRQKDLIRQQFFDKFLLVGKDIRFLIRPDLILYLHGFQHTGKNFRVCHLHPGTFPAGRLQLFCAYFLNHAAFVDESIMRRQPGQFIQNMTGQKHRDLPFPVQL